jgi:hypothetical protein
MLARNVIEAEVIEELRQSCLTSHHRIAQSSENQLDGVTPTLHPQRRVLQQYRS